MSKSGTRVQVKLPKIGNIFDKTDIPIKQKRKVYDFMNMQYKNRMIEDAIMNKKYKRICIICKRNFETDKETRVRCDTCFPLRKRS